MWVDLRLASKEGRAKALKLQQTVLMLLDIFFVFHVFFMGRDMRRNMLVTFEYKVHYYMSLYVRLVPYLYLYFLFFVIATSALIIIIIRDDDGGNNNIYFTLYMRIHK